MNTLKTIANESQVEYRTVQRWYSKAVEKYSQFGTLEGKTRYFTDEEKAQILEFQTKKVEAKPESSQNSEIQIFDAEIEETQPANQLPSAFNLAQFRNETFGSIDLSTAQTAIEITKQLRSALNADIESQWQQLEATKQASKELEKATAELDRQALIYQTESRILSRLQNIESRNVKEMLGKVQNLGS